MEKAQYELSDRARQERLRQFASVGSPEDLQPELASARLLAQESMEAGNIGLSNALLTTIGRLAQSQVAVKRLRSEYLERATVLRLAVELTGILSRAVEGKFDGWELTLAQCADEVGAAVAAASNQPRLEAPR